MTKPPPPRARADRPAPPPAAARRPSGEVRLIGGRLRRSRLAVPDRPGLRPTPDRVRETLFNWLGQDLTGWRVLDAFAGSGALGLEAASRGAAEVLLLDHDAQAVAAIAAAVRRLGADGARVERADARSWIARSGGARYELVLLDPPFDSGWAPALAAEAARLLVDDGFLFVEAAQALVPPPGLQALRHLRAGAVHAHLWQRAAVATLPPP